MDNIESLSNNVSVLDRCCSKLKVIEVKSAAAGDLANEKVKICHICKDNGWPHEAISFKTIGDGRLKTDGSREFRTYQILNYANDTPHEHRRYRRPGQ